MADIETAIEPLRERLTDLLVDSGAELSEIITELATKRARLKELQGDAEGRVDQLEELTEKLEHQEDLLATLRTDAENASKLRREEHDRDLELERVNSELASTQELILALRRDADGVDSLKAEAKLKDQEIARPTFKKRGPRPFVRQSARVVTCSCRCSAALTGLRRSSIVIPPYRL